jgi:hypothetical protein
MKKILEDSAVHIESMMKRMESNTPLTEEDFKRAFFKLESTIVALSKRSLAKLEKCNSEVENMLRDVAETEGLIGVIKDSKSQELRRRGVASKEGAMIPTANVESPPFEPFLFLDDERFRYPLAMDVLNGVGKGKGVELIPKIEKGAARSAHWVRLADYFAVPGNESKSVFAEVYTK